jgi:3-methyladenine DNA glycosylase Tag
MAHAPQKIHPKDLSDYFEALTKGVFRAGLNWRVVDAKWEDFREAFAGFNPDVVAAFGPDDVERLETDKRLIRSRQKVEATIANARAMVELDREFGGFDKYLASFPDFDSTVADLKRRFKHVGDFTAYFLLYVLGRPTPSHEEWMMRHTEHHHVGPDRRRTATP